MFYRQSGIRSAQICAFMAQWDLYEIYNLHGGIMSWIGSGGSLVSPKTEYEFDTDHL